MSWTWPSHLETQTKHPAGAPRPCHPRGSEEKEERERKKRNRQNPRTNGKSKLIQTKSDKVAYTYTLTKKGKRKNIYVKKGREQPNQ